MSKTKKSAKDIAFEKERAKFRSEIRNLQYQIAYRDRQIEELNETISQREAELFKQEEELFKQEDWIRRLLEYTEMSKKDLQMLIKSEKDKAEIREKVSTTLGIIGMVGRNQTLSSLISEIEREKAREQILEEAAEIEADYE